MLKEPARFPWKPVLLALALLAFGGVGYWLLQREPAPKDDPEVHAQAFALDLKSGDKARLEEAWQRTSAEFKSFEGKDAFRTAAMKQPVYRGLGELKSRETLSENGRSYEAFRFDTAAGKPVRIDLVAVNGEWQVERVKVEE